MRLAVPAALLFACVPPKNGSSPQGAADYVASMHLVRDARTGSCFLVRWDGFYQGWTVTQAPCPQLGKP